MTNNDNCFGHRNCEDDEIKTTVSQPSSHYYRLLAWAKEQGVDEIFQAVAATFGFTENFTIIGNLCRELSSSDAQAILVQWSDNPLVRQLARLLTAYDRSPEISTAFAGIPKGVSRNSTKVSLRAAGANLKDEHFLLEMIVTPPALAGNDFLHRLRQALRLWLIVQSLERVVSDHCFHDSQIQQVAGTLNLPNQDEKLHAIDSVLKRASKHCPTDEYSCEQFTLALRYASSQLLATYTGSRKKKKIRLLRALQAVAEGQRNPTEIERTAASVSLDFNSLEIPAWSIESSERDGQLPIFASSDSDSEEGDEEALEQFSLIEVSSEDTPERQRLSGRSVLLQTAEQACYLPWSWNKALPPEVSLLDEWLETTLEANDPRDKLGAAIVWLAVHLGRSLDFVLEFEITDETQNEWSISTDFRTLHRYPPRRHSSWYPDGEQRSMLEPFVEPLQLLLPESIHLIFKSHCLSWGSGQCFLFHIWNRSESTDIKTWFNGQSKKRFPRLSSGLLANIHSQRVFEAQDDHSLARLISAHPKSALPAACGYANWSIQQVQSGFALSVEGGGSRQQRVNAIGSVLAPLETVLMDEIRSASDQLSVDVPEDPIAFHNNVVRYVVAALYAATGCRYVTEPFESITHFCEHPTAVFINDKGDDGLHCGRLVPLADGAFNLVKEYCEHLRHLRESVSEKAPSLANGIDRVLLGQSDSLPFFFLLDHAGLWHPLSDDNVPGNLRFDWNLPKNLFRHRFSQQLARLGVDQEIIDGWMGHAERRVASYGDYSPRCWVNDADSCRSVLNQCFDRLGFLTHLPNYPWSEIAFVPIQSLKSYEEPQLFGQAKRHKARIHARNEARSKASKDLRLILKAKSLSKNSDLTQEDVDELAGKMIFREQGLVHPRAALRMEVLVQWLEDSGKDFRRFIKRRTTSFQNERSLLRDSSALALGVMPELRAWVREARQAIRQAQIPKHVGLVLATTFLAIEKRISYRRMLEDLIQGQNYRVLEHRQKVLLEYNETLDPENFDQPVQRHQIDHATGRLLVRGLGIKDSKQLEAAKCPLQVAGLEKIILHKWLDSGRSGKGLTLASLLTALHRIVEQANLVELPGMVAGSLSERHPPTSVSLFDYLRITENRCYELPAQIADVDLSLDRMPKIPPMASVNCPDGFYDNARRFILELHEIINDYSPHTPFATAKTIDRHCSDYARLISSAVLLLGYWISSRIRAGKGRKGQTHQPYAVSSVKRYLSSLSPAFRGLAYNSDFVLMADDEMTELCADMLEFVSSKQQNLKYFSVQLIEFFDWAGDRGIATPDWDELSLGCAARSVRPRLFTENEYGQCLELLLQDDVQSSIRGLQSAFVLLLAYRFGLRAQEAIGLLRSDWCESAGLTWVLVQNNSLRTLKNPQNSRRVVPLMMELSEQEKRLIEFVLSRYDAAYGNVKNKPLLVTSEGDFIPYARSIPSEIAARLQVVTGNPKMTLHQARHSFCNVLTRALMDIDTELGHSLTNSIDDKNVRRILLGSEGAPSRRSAMAISRALGHSSPRTQFRSYNHLMTDWADKLTPVESHNKRAIQGAVRIYEWSTVSSYEPSDKATVFSDRVKLMPLLVVQALRLMALGYPAEIIEGKLNLFPEEIANLETFVDRINASLRFKVWDPEKNKIKYTYGDCLPKQLIKARSNDFWRRLIKLTNSLPRREELGPNFALPTLTHASNLIGRNGQLLMSQAEEFDLMRLVVDSLDLSENYYRVILKGKDNEIYEAEELLKEYEFEETRDPRAQLDTFNIDYNAGLSRIRAYAGLDIVSPAVGPFHNNHEFVVGFIAIAASYCPQVDIISINH